MLRTPPAVVRASAAALLALAAAAGCGRTDDPVGPTTSITGRWTGHAQLNLLHFSATFTQNGEAVTGLGEFSSPIGSGPFSVTGSYVTPRVTLTLVSAELGTTGYEGTLSSANEINGRLTTPPYDGMELTLRRD
jgi:hypothetical protein